MTEPDAKMMVLPVRVVVEAEDNHGGAVTFPSGRWVALSKTDYAALRTAPVAGRDACADCGHPRAEHSYNGACYGLCGKFVAAPSPAQDNQLGSSEPLGPHYDGTTMDNQQLHGTTRRNQPVVTAGETATQPARDCKCPTEVIADVLRLGIIGDIEGAPEIVALDIIEHIERRGFSICALPTQPAREASETCQTCMGSGYSNHPDSGEVCQTCGGQGEQPAVIVWCPGCSQEVEGKCHHWMCPIARNEREADYQHGEEALEAETSRADENSISCMAFINVLRSIIRNSPDAYAVKVAEEAIKMPWLAQSPKAPAGKMDFE